MTGKRHGTTIIELAASMIILAAVLVAIAQTVAMRAQQRRATQRHLLAVNEAANLMERIVMQSWDEVTADNLATMTLSAEAQRTLSAARQKIDVESVEQDVAAKRVRIEIDWQNGAGQREEPVRLAAWKYRVERSE